MCAAKVFNFHYLFVTKKTAGHQNVKKEKENCIKSCSLKSILPAAKESPESE